MTMVNKTDRGFMADLKELCYMIEAEQGFENMDAVYALVTREKNVFTDMISAYENPDNGVSKMYFFKNLQGNLHTIYFDVLLNDIYQKETHNIHFYEVSDSIYVGYSLVPGVYFHRMDLIKA